RMWEKRIGLPKPPYPEREAQRVPPDVRSQFGHIPANRAARRAGVRISDHARQRSILAEDPCVRDVLPRVSNRAPVTPVLDSSVLSVPQPNSFERRRLALGRKQAAIPKLPGKRLGCFGIDPEWRESNGADSFCRLANGALKRNTAATLASFRARRFPV